MSSSFKIVLLIFAFLFLQGSKLLADNNSQADTLILDQGQIEIHKKEISQGRIESYRQQKDFNYEYSEVKNIGFFEKLRLLFARWISIISKGLGAVWFMRYIIGAGILIFLIIVIAKSNASGIFRPHQKVISIPFADELNPESVNWEEQIQKAVSSGEYRLAVRYQFLSTLKSLSKNNFINWKVEKTNYDYINEINDSKVKTVFNELSNLYEAVWYGNFPIVKEEYASIGKDFEQFNASFQTRNE
ncbi:hypothetical protein [Marinifilum caeruleilacunae]|uniref:DUF4129 domain-containing protein n=1 Tax=Marinifilum caeruleilacunae TaxID=2499076 RepID=A0ABX1WT95_9BACT|nr:hypothetical protein [Marinifilum caeruleilacunae]NOU59165.1 hypothetical protein [Marinifilum caeruleilacunae]